MQPKTVQEYLQRMLAEMGREDSFYGETFLLPFQIEKLKLTKVGPFENFEVSFKAGSINVIHGVCGSGKSTIIRSFYTLLASNTNISPIECSAKVQ